MPYIRWWILKVCICAMQTKKKLRRKPEVSPLHKPPVNRASALTITLDVPRRSTSEEAMIAHPQQNLVCSDSLRHGTAANVSSMETRQRLL
jgi:hypothetical protein